jgi:hypothetical protein
VSGFLRSLRHVFRVLVLVAVLIATTSVGRAFDRPHDDPALNLTIAGDGLVKAADGRAL